jgi:hypothetical protein
MSYYNREVKWWALFMSILMTFPLLGLAGARIYNGIIWDIDCGGHLKRAADANTVDLAVQELEVVVKYLEDNRMTEGYTSVLYREPSEDVGFWYNNIKASLVELKALPKNATDLEKSNMLMKLRQTLLDHSNGTENVTKPDGISRFPNNKVWWGTGMMGMLSLMVGAVFAFVWLRSMD